VLSSLNTQHPSKEMKRCFKCEADKPFAEFYRHPEMKDGFLGKCKECAKDDMHKNRQNNLERYRAYDRERGGRQTLEYQRNYRRANPEKYSAHQKLAYAVRTGRLVRPPTCERCPSKKVHGHHDDYTKPLKVMWLCAVCHKQRHKELLDNDKT